MKCPANNKTSSAKHAFEDISAALNGYTVCPGDWAIGEHDDVVTNGGLRCIPCAA
jgi:hypothetical protein